MKAVHDRSMLASYRYCVCSRTGPTIAHSWMSGKDKLCVKKESRLFIRTTSVTTKEWGEEKRNARGEEQWAAGGSILSLNLNDLGSSHARNHAA